MPRKPSGSQKTQKTFAARNAATLPGEPAAKKQKLKPLSALARPAIVDLIDYPTSQGSSNSQPTTRRSHVKEKQATGVDKLFLINGTDNQMWIDLYEPSTEEDLAVHKRKVQDVRHWFLEAFQGGPSGKLHKYRRILVLTGPAGTAKTATVRVLAKELDAEILEWRNSIDDKHHRDDILGDTYDDLEYEGLLERFQTFLARAANCHSVLDLNPSSSTTTSKRRIVLLEDLPNVLHEQTQRSFHDVLEALVKTSSPCVSPIVIIISDAGLRGEADPDEMGSSSSWKGKARENMDIRTVLPRDLIGSPYATHIEFNPIAPTLMRRTLQHILTNRFSAKSGSKTSGSPPSKDVLDFIIESSNGDIRSAIMALQFATTSTDAGSDSRLNGQGKGRLRKSAPTRALMEVVTRREQSLALFHLIGKLLYNKRKGDPPSFSASAKDVQRDRDIDTHLKDPPKLPPHLQHHERKTSRVDVEALYADSPIDSGLLSLYLHQNYTQYCDDLEQCGDLVDWLSWTDSHGGDSWYRGNPHQFHLISLGTLHSLPSPVARRNQKNYKPEFFDVLKRERETEDSIRDTHQWLRRDEYGSAGAWTLTKIALELGAVAKARGQHENSNANRSTSAPGSSRLFSHLQFTQEPRTTLKLAKDDFHADVTLLDDPYLDGHGEQTEAAQPSGGWLHDDDIEDF